MVLQSRFWNIFICLLIVLGSYSQNKFFFDSATIEIKPLNINTGESEFSPFKIGKVFYYTSSKERKIGVTHMEINTERQMLDIYKGIIKDSVTIKNVSPLPNKINNSTHQGSCFFDRTSARLYYSSDVLTNSHYKKYKLAIFSSEFKEGEFLQPRIELILADTFSCAHPIIYRDRLYFSSNLPGGKGKTDIYYAEKFENQWANIKSCSFLNTSENEYFPFVMNENEIYFSSDRNGGYGKLDIYKCTGSDSLALIQNLGSPINSSSDDFGVYIDTLQENGYFSTNRKKKQDDIYFFVQTWPVFNNCKEAVVEDYCYNLTEESSLDPDSQKGYYYEWNFGDGLKARGLSVRHCFIEPGNYLINLNIIDSVTRAVFMSQATFDLKVDSIVQLKINTLDTVLINKKFNINTDWTYLPDNKINGYYYEIDGERRRGESQDVLFSELGKHKVLLGVSTYNVKTKLKELLCTTKEIVSVDSLKWLAVEKRKIKEIADKFAYKRFPADSVLLSNMNYSDVEMEYNKKGLNGALVAAEIKKIVDEKIASKTNLVDNVAVNKNLNDKEKTNENEKANLANLNTETNGDENSSGQKYLNPIMDTLMNLKEDNDVTFKVHLGKSKLAKDTTLLNSKGINGIEEKVINDEYHYTYGNEKKIADIEKYYDKTIKAGVEDAVVVGYKNDSIVGTQNNSLKGVDFDKVKTKEDSVRIANNIAAKYKLNNKNSTDYLAAEELRAKANKLLAVAAQENNKVEEIKTEAETKPEREKDSLTVVASTLKVLSQDKEIEASALNQKANSLDYKSNSSTIKELLTKLKNDEPILGEEVELKNNNIESLKIATEALKKEATQIANKTEKIAALNNINDKEKEILQKQEQLLSELKNKYPDYIANNNKQNNTNKDLGNSKLTSNQLRAKALKLETLASNENLKADKLKIAADAKPEREKDSLLKSSKELKLQSQNNLIEASTLKQKANQLDYNSRSNSIEALLTKLKMDKPVLFDELEIKNKNIESLKLATETLKEEANQISDKVDKIAALNSLNEKENEILQKQEQLLSELKKQNPDYVTNTKNNSNSIIQNDNYTDNNKSSNLNKTSSNNTSNKNKLNNSTNSTNKNLNKNSSDNYDDENDFDATTDIQKTNMEYLAEFGDLSAEDLEFKVQVGVFKKRTTYNFPKLKGHGEVKTERLKDGSTRMTMGGSYKTLRQAFQHNRKINKAGQKDAFVSVYYKGQRIGIENLRRKGVLVKTQVVTDSVSENKITINASNLIEYAQMDFGDETTDDEQTLTKKTKEVKAIVLPETSIETEENLVFVPRTNIQKKTVFYAEKYGNISVDGLEFKVQIAIFKYRNSYSFPKLKSLGKIETETADEGGTRMTIGGSFKTLNEAFEFNKKVVIAGQTDAFVSVYYQGKRIYIENLERRGIFVNKD
ncbi:MAG: PKD domain-containing protein [Bacteroidota bacterium]|nr:PKD domain-containing protein [Bacteroidota bacterium]